MSGLGSHSVEAAVGVKGGGELVDERTHLVRKAATLRARHGSFGTWDHERKVLLAKLRATIRAGATVGGAKMTEAAIDDAAHAHPDYVQFITDGIIDKAKWIEAEAVIEGIDFQFYRDQAVMRLHRENGL